MDRKMDMKRWVFEVRHSSVKSRVLWWHYRHSPVFPLPALESWKNFQLPTFKIVSKWLQEWVLASFSDIIKAKARAVVLFVCRMISHTGFLKFF
jgi:hypothetical protein